MPRRSSKPPRKPPRPSSANKPPRRGLGILRGREPGSSPPAVDATDPAHEAARAASFRHHARTLGGLWVGVGVVLAAVGVGGLGVAWATRAGDLAPVWPLILVVVLGLGLVATGVGACRRSVWAIYLGMGLNATPLALGYVAVPLAMIVLASRTIRLSRPPRPGVVPVRLAGAILSRLAVAILAVYLGGLVGGVAGGLAGGAVGAIAAATHYLTIDYGLSLLAAVSMGAVAGAGAAGLSGLVVGLAAGRLSPQGRALANLGGLGAGLGAEVGWVLFGTSAGAGLASLGRSELIVLVLISIIAAILGAGLGPLVAGRLARSFAGPDQLIRPVPSVPGADPASSPH